MAKFIQLNVTGNASNFLNGPHLLNANHVSIIQQTAAETVVITMDHDATVNIITFTLSTETASNVNPVYATGAPAQVAINNALTANPGGVKSTVNWGRDDAGDQVYARAIAYA